MRRLTRIHVMICVLPPIFAACASAQPLEVKQPSVRTSPDSIPPSTSQQRGYTGLYFRSSVTMTPDHQMHRDYSSVAHIDSGSPAEKAGLAAGDMILEVNGTDTRTPVRGIFAFVPGRKYILRIRRGQEEREIVLIPISRSH